MQKQIFSLIYVAAKLDALWTHLEATSLSLSRNVNDPLQCQKKMGSRKIKQKIKEDSHPVAKDTFDIRDCEQHREFLRTHVKATSHSLSVNTPLGYVYTYHFSHRFLSAAPLIFSTYFNFICKQHHRNAFKTRLHSSGMRAARLLTVSQHALRRGCLPRGWAVKTGVKSAACKPGLRNQNNLRIFMLIFFPGDGGWFAWRGGADEDAEPFGGGCERREGGGGTEADLHRADPARGPRSQAHCWPGTSTLLTDVWAT